MIRLRNGAVHVTAHSHDAIRDADHQHGEDVADRYVEHDFVARREMGQPINDDGDGDVYHLKWLKSVENLLILCFYPLSRVQVFGILMEGR
jgi:hypothetical protein